MLFGISFEVKRHLWNGRKRMRAGARIGIVLRQRDIDREAEIDRD